MEMSILFDAITRGDARRGEARENAKMYLEKACLDLFLLWFFFAFFFKNAYVQSYVDVPMKNWQLCGERVQARAKTRGERERWST